MVQGSNNVLAWFNLQGKPYFSIFRKAEKESTNVVFTNKDRENESMESAYSYLSQCLSLIKTGEFFIYCHSTQAPTSKGRSETFFTIPFNDSVATATQPTIAGTGAGLMDYETMLAKAGEIATEKFERLMEKQRLKEAQEKLAEATKELNQVKKEQDSRWNKFFDAAAPYIPNVIQGLFPQGSAPAGIGNIPKPDEVIHDNSTAEANEEAMTAAAQGFCEALQQRYPITEGAQPGYLNWVQILQRLTIVIKNEPAKIDMALKLL